MAGTTAPNCVSDSIPARAAMVLGAKSVMVGRSVLDSTTKRFAQDRADLRGLFQECAVAVDRVDLAVVRADGIGQGARVAHRHQAIAAHRYDRQRRANGGGIEAV